MTAHRAWLVIFAASSAFVIAACGETASEPSATVPPATAPVSTSSPTAAASTDSPTVAPSAAGITGYGATVADWNSAHTQAPFCAPGGCYDPDPSLAQVNGHEGVRYFGVSTSNGRVLDYSMAFAHGTPQSIASATVMREFPSDVAVLWTTTKATCYQMEVTSATLGGVLGRRRSAIRKVTSSLSSTPTRTRGATRVTRATACARRSSGSAVTRPQAALLPADRRRHRARPRRRTGSTWSPVRVPPGSDADEILGPSDRAVEVIGVRELDGV